MILKIDLLLLNRCSCVLCVMCVDVCSVTLPPLLPSHRLRRGVGEHSGVIMLPLRAHKFFEGLFTNEDARRRARERRRPSSSAQNVSAWQCAISVKAVRRLWFRCSLSHGSSLCVCVCVCGLGVWCIGVFIRHESFKLSLACAGAVDGTVYGFG